MLPLDDTQAYLALSISLLFPSRQSWQGIRCWLLRKFRKICLELVTLQVVVPPLHEHDELIDDILIIYVTGFGKTDQVVTFCISRNTVLKH